MMSVVWGRRPEACGAEPTADSSIVVDMILRLCKQMLT
jgi:hypothetical protein